MSKPAASGRCYCSASRLIAQRPPITVAFCHCNDCKRWTGAPAPAFAALDRDALVLEGKLRWFTAASGVDRCTCSDCGSPMAATFDYLPGQIYVPLGVLDQAHRFPPALHCHSDQEFQWLCLKDGAPRQTGSAADLLLLSEPQGDTPAS